MRTIQIAPHSEDCRIEGNKIIGTMGGQTFVFELPSDELPYTAESMIANFREAIALSSRNWQVEQLLNDHWGVNGKFYSL